MSLTPQQLAYYWQLRSWPRFWPAKDALAHAADAWFVSRRDFYARVRIEVGW